MWRSELRLGRRGRQRGLLPTLLAFPAGAGVPSGSTVLSATLNVNVLGVFGSTTTWLFQLARPFTPGGASWDNAGPGQPWSSPGGDGAQPLQAAQQVGATGTASFSVTKLVQSWVDGADPELIMLPASAKGNAFSVSSVASGQGPNLVIAYQPPSPPVQVTPQPTPIPQGSGAHALKVKLVFAWTWRGDVIALRRAVLGRSPGDLTLSVRCRGRNCPSPADRTATGRAAARRLLHRLAGARFHAGNVVLVTLTASGYRPERAELRIRRDRVPLVRSLHG